MCDIPIPERGGLTEENLDLLLSCLDPNREDAGHKFLLVWKKLQTFFHKRKCLSAEDLADLTLNRVAQKIKDGEDIRNISAYSLTVARYVYLEHFRKSPARSDIEEIEKLQIEPVDEIEKEETRKLLEECLHTLPEDDAKLFLKYWLIEDNANHDVRRLIMEELGISANALRIRIFRIRTKLEKCINNRLTRVSSAR